MFAYSNFHVENPCITQLELLFQSILFIQNKRLTTTFSPNVKFDTYFLPFGPKKKLSAWVFLAFESIWCVKTKRYRKKQEQHESLKGRTCDGSVIDMWLEHPVPSTHLCLYRRHADQTMTRPKCACFSQFSLLLFILISSLCVGRLYPHPVRNTLRTPHTHTHFFGTCLHSL